MAAASSLPFRNRSEAGRVLARQLTAYADRSGIVVLALPRGGVPVGFEVATALHAPLDVFLVRKLGVPGYEELAFGAIASGGVRVLNQGIVDELGLRESDIAAIAARESAEMSLREGAYRLGRPPQPVRDNEVILVDDGLATGATMRAAAQAIRAQGAARIIVAVPVAARDTYDAFLAEVDEVVCVATPEPFDAVGRFYQDFSQTTDDEVRALLARAAQEGPRGR